MGCEGNCNDCSPKTTESCDPSPGRGVPIKGDIAEYLKPLAGPPADSTPLDRLCHCTTHKLKRSACLTCIRSFVNAVCPCKVKKAIKEYKKVSVITVERLEICLEERRRREISYVDSLSLDPIRHCSGDCGGSSCKCEDTPEKE